MRRVGEMGLLGRGVVSHTFAEVHFGITLQAEATILALRMELDACRVEAEASSSSLHALRRQANAEQREAYLRYVFPLAWGG